VPRSFSDEIPGPHRAQALRGVSFWEGVAGVRDSSVSCKKKGEVLAEDTFLIKQLTNTRAGGERA